MKRNLIIITIVILTITAVIVADYLRWLYVKFEGISPYLAYFYLLLLLVGIIYGVAIPLWRIFTAPSMPSLRISDLPEDREQLYKFGNTLANNNNYISAKDDRKSHRKELSSRLIAVKDSDSELTKILIEEIDKRNKLIDAKIREQALSVFMITGLSQNGKFDFLANLVINLRLIHQVIELSGFRPTYAQISRLYIEVILASIITDISEEMLDDIDFSTVFEKVNLPVIFVKSFIDGSMSAIMTLRIGYITKYYIMRGTKELRKIEGNKRVRSKIRHEAILSSLAAYPVLAKEAAVKIKKSSFSFFGNSFKKLLFSFGWGKKKEATE